MFSLCFFVEVCKYETGETISLFLNGAVGQMISKITIGNEMIEAYQLDYHNHLISFDAPGMHGIYDVSIEFFDHSKTNSLPVAIQPPDSGLFTGNDFSTGCSSNNNLEKIIYSLKVLTGQSPEVPLDLMLSYSSQFGEQIKLYFDTNQEKVDLIDFGSESFNPISWDNATKELTVLIPYLPGARHLSINSDVANMYNELFFTLPQLTISDSKNSSDVIEDFEIQMDSYADNIQEQMAESQQLSEDDRKIFTSISSTLKEIWDNELSQTEKEGLAIIIDNGEIGSESIFQNTEPVSQASVPQSNPNVPVALMSISGTNPIYPYVVPYYIEVDTVKTEATCNEINYARADELLSRAKQFKNIESQNTVLRSAGQYLISLAMSPQAIAFLALKGLADSIYKSYLETSPIVLSALSLDADNYLISFGDELQLSINGTFVPLENVQSAIISGIIDTTVTSISLALPVNTPISFMNDCRNTITDKLNFELVRLGLSSGLSTVPFSGMPSYDSETVSINPLSLAASLTPSPYTSFTFKFDEDDLLGGYIYSCGIVGDGNLDPYIRTIANHKSLGMLNLKPPSDKKIVNVSASMKNILDTNISSSLPMAVVNRPADLKPITVQALYNSEITIRLAEYKKGNVWVDQEGDFIREIEIVGDTSFGYLDKDAIFPDGILKYTQFSGSTTDKERLEYKVFDGAEWSDGTIIIDLGNPCTYTGVAVDGVPNMGVAAHCKEKISDTLSIRYVIQETANENVILIYNDDTGEHIDTVQVSKDMTWGARDNPNLEWQVDSKSVTRDFCDLPTQERCLGASIISFYPDYSYSFGECYNYSSELYNDGVFVGCTHGQNWDSVREAGKIEAVEYIKDSVIHGNLLYPGSCHEWWDHVDEEGVSHQCNY